MGIFGGNDGPDIQPIDINQIRNEAISSQIANLPRIIRAFGENAPELGEANLAAFTAANPRIAQTIRSLGGLLNNRLAQVSAGGIPETLRSAFTENLRGAQSIRGLASGGASAAQEAVLLGQLGEQFAQNTIGSALNFGRLREGDTPTLGSLGLDQGSISNTVNQFLEVNDANQAILQQEALDEQRRLQSLGGLIGAGVGFATGGPAGATLGFSTGEVGGTFF
jgi:hypothetical protein